MNKCCIYEQILPRRNPFHGIMMLLPFIFAVASICSGCQSEESVDPVPANDKECVIVGDVDGIGNHRLLLLDIWENNLCILGKTKARKGKFIIRVNVDSPTNAQLFIRPLHTPPFRQFILEPGVIRIDGKMNDGFLKVSGTADNDRFARFLRDIEVPVNLDSLLVTYSSDSDIFKMYLLDRLKFMGVSLSPASFCMFNGLDTVFSSKPSAVESYGIMKTRTSNIQLQGEGILNVLKVDEDGNAVPSSGSFYDYVGNGKYAMVVFWASWCGPCKAEAPLIDSIFRTYKDDGLNVVGVSYHDKLSDLQYVTEKLGLHYDQIIDADSEIIKKYGVKGVPHIILFDQNGEILVDGIPDPDNIEPAVRKALGLK